MRQKVTGELLDAANRLRAAGLKWVEIAERLGHSKPKSLMVLAHHRKHGRWATPTRDRLKLLDAKLEELVLVDGIISEGELARHVGLRTATTARRCRMIGLDGEMRRELAGTEKLAA